MPEHDSVSYSPVLRGDKEAQLALERAKYGENGSNFDTSKPAMEAFQEYVTSLPTIGNFVRLGSRTPVHWREATRSHSYTSWANSRTARPLVDRTSYVQPGLRRMPYAPTRPGSSITNRQLENILLFPPLFTPRSSASTLLEENMGYGSYIRDLTPGQRAIFFQNLRQWNSPLSNEPSSSSSTAPSSNRSGLQDGTRNTIPTAQAPSSAASTARPNLRSSNSSTAPSRTRSRLRDGIRSTIPTAQAPNSAASTARPNQRSSNSSTAPSRTRSRSRDGIRSTIPTAQAPNSAASTARPNQRSSNSSTAPSSSRRRSPE